MPTNHVRNRDAILACLRAELVGPAPVGEPIDCTGDVTFDTPAEAFKPWRQMGNGEEILQRDAPTRRYGIGVLYPLGDDSGDTEPDPNAVGQAVVDEEARGVAKSERVLMDSAEADLERLESRTSKDAEDEDDDGEIDLSSTNTYKPSAMAVSFLTELRDDCVLSVRVAAGRYRRKPVHSAGKIRAWWLRESCDGSATFSGNELTGEECRRAVRRLDTPSLAGLDVRIECYSRPHGEGARLVTVCLINRTPAAKSRDERSLFQSRFVVTVDSPNGAACIRAYPDSPDTADAEEQGIALLYRAVQTFAIGHGCAADWEPASSEGRARSVSAECLPVTETPSMTPDIELPGGRSRLEIEMRPLAGLIPEDDGTASLNSIVGLYETWIADRRAEVGALAARYRDAASRHLGECDRAARRMRQGLAFLASDAQARLAFQLANRAMLLQQVNGARSLREAGIDPQTHRTVFSGTGGPPDLSQLASGHGKWRPFQIAFMLMVLPSAVDGSAPDRRTVELIWFPTGGGKTEAYLGLAAYTMFYRRLAHPDDSGTAVLMRYTLRLLTAQQFQRASRLICAMEYLRRRDRTRLGDDPISIGIWLGSSSTPNSRYDAVKTLGKLAEGDRFTKNKFLLDQCPWCKAPLGPIDEGGGADTGKGVARRNTRGRGQGAQRRKRVLGYEQRGDTVAFFCPDASCEFAEQLPVYVVDEDIYDVRPEFLIGTVDKFAALAWKDEARSMFGLAPDGLRFASPPGLIIQDELHLIAGPLGSMVGLYEVLVEELCTDRRQPVAVPPKIICSTATIRRYREQVHALYRRSDTVLFPPPGLNATDSFFARYAREPDGSLSRGRIYVGVHGPGLGSLQTAQVRTIGALLQAAQALDGEARDPWWTVLLFFNSLRELGSTLSLIQSDIPDHLRVLKNRLGVDWDDLRSLRRIEELTSRLQNEEVPAAIKKLEVTTTSDGIPVDICLASNIIEVGVDIDRLSLMAVIGQPKTTAQYIQVTGRVGRRVSERPGLVVTIYSASKARDRSHFEKFRSYHEKLYAQVEPTSVTPFSRPVLDRALHAVMAAYTRQTANTHSAARPTPFPAATLARLRELLLVRVQDIDPTERRTLEQVFARREREWRAWQPRVWSSGGGGEDGALLRQAGSYVDPVVAQRTWATPTSLRSVDAECQAAITALYDIVGATDV